MDHELLLLNERAHPRREDLLHTPLLAAAGPSQGAARTLREPRMTTATSGTAHCISRPPSHTHTKQEDSHAPIMRTSTSGAGSALLTATPTIPPVANAPMRASTVSACARAGCAMSPPLGLLAAPLYAHELEGRRGEQAEDAEDAERDGALREPPRDGVQDRAVRPVCRALDAVCVCEADLRGRSGGALGEGRTTDHEGDHEDEGGEGVGRDHQLREV
jgi:hypothetical protein